MKELFFELLQVSLGTRVKLSRVPNAREWEALYDEADRQAIIGVMLTGLERLSDEQLPPLDLKLQWIGMVQMMEAEYKQHCERAAELTSRFRAVGIKSCILKGVALAQLYPHPERRQCGDIDVWVDGRRKDVLAWSRTQCEVGKVKWHHVDAEFFPDVSVEVHSHPAWVYNPVNNHRLQQFFERNKDAQMVEKKALGFAHPTARFDAVFSLVHSFHHLLEEGVGLRHIVDYYYVLRQVQDCPSGESAHARDKSNKLGSPLAQSQTSGFKVQDLRDILRHLGLAKFAGAVMWVMKEVCGMPESELLCSPDEKEGKFLLSEIMA